MLIKEVRDHLRTLERAMGIMRGHLLISGNSKAGAAWNIAAMLTCPGMTSYCTAKRRLANGEEAKSPICYAVQGRMGMSQHAYKRNWERFEDLLAAHGAVLAGKYLGLLLVERALKGGLTAVRFHGSGDIYSAQYGEALYHASLIIRSYGLKPYTYTKSFVVPTLLGAIAKLATVCDVNFSADRANVDAALDAYEAVPNIRRIAGMYGDADKDFVERLTSARRASQLVFFPAHSGGLETTPIKGIPNCPAIIGVLPRADKAGDACQQCVGMCHA